MGRHAETDSVKGWDGDVIRLHARGMQGGYLQQAGAISGMLRSVGRAWRQMRRDRPDVVLAMGSYASVGPAIAARLLRVPLVLHEGNAMPGRAIRFLAPLASRIGTGFPQATRYFPSRKVSYCGFPVRAAFRAAMAQHPATKERSVLLVMGGSQGASILNRVLPEALQVYRDMGRVLPPVFHITGHREKDAVAEQYLSRGIEARVVAFHDDMVGLLAQTRFAITRGGAATCTELAMMQVPGVLVPLPHAPGNHQWHNACAMAETGAFCVMSESDLTPSALARTLGEMLDTPKERAQRCLLPAGIPTDGAVRLADVVEQTVPQ